MGEVKDFEAARRRHAERNAHWLEVVAAHLGVHGLWPEDAMRIAMDLRASAPSDMDAHQAAHAYLQRMAAADKDPFE